MLIDIKPISTLAISVREDIIAAVLSWLGRDYMSMLIEFWGFAFLPEDPKLPGKLGNRIDLDKGNLVKPLEMFYGIKLATQTEQREKGLLAIIEAELNKNLPVILTMQTMYLPYHWTYQKPEESHPHQILVTGIDQHKIYWIDPACSKNVESLAREEFTPGMISAETFVITDNKAEDLDWRQVVKSIVKKVRTPKNGHKDTFEAIRDFADKIISLDITVETDGRKFDIESLRFNLFIFKLDQLSRGRNTIANVFDNLGEKYNLPELKTIAEQFRVIAREWVRVRYIIIKGVTTPSDKTSIIQAAEKIKKLADREEEMAGILESICDHDTELRNIKQGNLTNVKDNKITEVKFVDLTPYYNNHGFAADSSKDTKAQLNMSRRAYYLPEGLPSGEIVEAGGMKFRFPVISEGSNDNVYGCGQWIDIPPGNYKTIMLLGFSLLKGYAGTLSVLYKDGEQEEVDFALSHIGATFPLYEETVAWEGWYYEKTSIAKAHLFCKEYQLRKYGTVKAVKIPDWPMFSIVSISLGK